jgi:hypothetical protein
MADDKKDDGTKDTPKPDEKKPDTVLDPKAKPEEKPAEGEKKDETPKPDSKEPQAKVPEKYELKRPEDALFTDSDMKQYEAQAKELGLTQAQAQKRLALDVANAASIRTTFLEELKADPQIGGDKLDNTVALALKGVDAFFAESPAEEAETFKQLLTVSGYGNHKALVRAFARLGKMMGEDKPDSGGKGGGKENLSDAEAFYGKG